MELTEIIEYFATKGELFPFPEYYDSNNEFLRVKAGLKAGTVSGERFAAFLNKGCNGSSILNWYQFQELTVSYWMTAATLSGYRLLPEYERLWAEKEFYDAEFSASIENDCWLVTLSTSDPRLATSKDELRQLIKLMFGVWCAVECIHTQAPSCEALNKLAKAC